MRAEHDAASDPLERLLLASRLESLRLDGVIGVQQAVALLGDLFAPRPIEKVELVGDGFVVLD